MPHEEASIWLRRFLDALERFDGQAVAEHLSDDIRHIEYPNALIPKGLIRDKQTMTKSLDSGRQNLARQSYRVTNLLVQGDRLAFESDWEGELARPLGKLPAGYIMKATFGVFLRFENGKVTSWHNFDCFEPF
jgi:ketosteroid isomerase-like protein